MALVTAAGILIEVVGLALAAWGIVRSWREVGGEFSILTGKHRGPIRGELATAVARGKIRMRGRATIAGETPEQAVTAIRQELDAVYSLLDAEEDARERADGDLGGRVAALAGSENEREVVRTRVDTRRAAGGLVLAAIGAVVQLVGALIGS